MRSVRSLFLAIGVFAIVLAAAIQLRTDTTTRILTTPPAPLRSTPAPTGPSTPGETFYVRPSGPKGEMIAYDMSTARPRFTLPRGIRSANGKRYYAATTQPDGTILGEYDLQTGSLAHSTYYEGLWMLAAVSTVGDQVALRRISTDKEMFAWAKQHDWKTTIQIVSSADGSASHLLRLDGNFEVSAFSRAGDALFLTQYLPPVDPDHFVLRLYDLAHNEFVPDPMLEQSRAGVMPADPFDQVNSVDGRWTLSFLIDSPRTVAFLQVIDSDSKFANYIPLPSGGQSPFGALGDYFVIFGPGSLKAFVLNPSLHIVCEFDLESRTLIRTLYYSASASVTPIRSGPAAPAPRDLGIISQDGKTLYLAGGDALWVFDMDDGTVRGPFAVGGRALGLGLSSSGAVLFAATERTELARAFNVLGEGQLSPLN